MKLQYILARCLSEHDWHKLLTVVHVILTLRCALEEDMQFFAQQVAIVRDKHLCLGSPQCNCLGIF